MSVRIIVGIQAMRTGSYDGIAITGYRAEFSVPATPFKEILRRILHDTGSKALAKLRSDLGANKVGHSAPHIEGLSDFEVIDELLGEYEARACESVVGQNGGDNREILRRASLRLRFQDLRLALQHEDLQEVLDVLVGMNRRSG